MQRKWKRRWQRLAKAILPPMAAGLLLLSAYSPAFANPAGGTVASGSVTIQNSGSTMTINQSTNKAIINWQSFSIGKGETVQFVQPGTSSVALNRVIGSDPSAIYGTLTANGKVYLVNPNGILFAPGSSVNVGGLVASTLNIADSDFLNGSYSFSGSGGSVTNAGSITAANEAVFIGPQVKNEGMVIAKVAGLAAGNKVSLDFAGDKLLNVTVDTAAAGSSVTNSGSILADGGLVVMTTGTKDALLNTVVNNSGVVRAQTVNNVNGVIRLIGSTVNVGGTLDASAPNDGDGGFIETSGAKVSVRDSAKITTLSAYGKNGTWLIDPDGFTIAASGGDMTGTAVSNALAGGNFQIQSTSGGGADGNINVNDAVTWSANKLTLIATNDVNINAVMTANNTASLDLEPGSGKVNMGLNGSGFTGRVDFFQANGVTPRSGTGFLTVSGHDYTVITDLGSEGSTTGTDLQGINGNPSGYYALGANIDASATQTWSFGFTPIGTYYPGYFSGTFDGLGHTIDRLYINLDYTNYVGLFSFALGASFRNVGLTNVNITGGNDVNYVGGLVGYNAGYNGTASITNSYITGAVTGGSGTTVGGLVGYNDGYNGTASITNSYSTAAVTGGSGATVGGLVGVNDDGSITNSYSTGAVTVTDGINYNYTNVGGLVGDNSGSITNSYSTGTVTGGSAANVGGLVGINGGSITGSYSTAAVTGGNTNVGGLVGYNDGASGSSSTASITNSYSAGTVTGGVFANVGGLVGVNDGNRGTASIANSYSTGAVTGGSGATVGGLVGVNIDNGGVATISNAYWNTNTSGQNDAIGSNQSSSSVTVTGLTTAGMMQAASYSGWGFDANGTTAAWHIYDGYSYPLLRAFLTPLTVTANNVTRTYDGTTGDNNSGMTYSTTPSGLLIGSAAYDSASQAAFNAGTYTITPSGFYSTVQGGYDITYAPGTLTINPAVLTVTANSTSKTYGQTTTFTGGEFTASGLQNGETISSVTLSSAGAAATANVSGTPYAITATNATGGTFNAGNYTITYLNGTLTINPAALTVTAATNSKTYDGTTTATVTPTVTSGSLQGSDSFTSLTEAYIDKNAGTGKTLKATAVISDGNGGNNYTITYVDDTTGTISKAALTVTATGQNKVYDGLTSASVTFGDNRVAGDVLTVSDTSAAFGDKNVGTGKTVSVGGISVSGADAGNYTLTGTTATTTADITARSLTVTATGQNKIYDGLTSASVTLGDNRVAGDVLTVGDTSAAFGDKNVGTGKTVSVGGISVSGADAGNYTYNTTATTTADITARSLTVTASGQNKVYDGLTSTTVTYGDNRVSGDVLTIGGSAAFTDKNVGTGKAVSVGGISVSGADAGNYTYNTTATTTADITARSLTVTASGQNKVYDGLTSASVTFGDNRVAGDVLTVSDTSAAFGDKNVGTGKTVSVGGISVSGADAGNYTFNTTATTTANITAAHLSASGVTVQNKVYDGTTTASLNAGGSLTGTIYTASGDSVTLSTGGATAAFDNKNVGTGKQISISGLALTGTGATNYVLDNANGYTTSADITARSLTVTASGQNKVYDGLTSTTVTYGDNRVSGDVLTIGGSAAFADKNVGTGKAVSISGITLSGADAGNYTLTGTTASTTADITKAALTVTANNASRYTGQANPAFTATYSGLVGGDTTASLTGNLTFATTAESASSAGSYAITLTGTLASPNYTVSYVDGVLTVRPASNPSYTGAVGTAGQTGSGVGIIGGGLGPGGYWGSGSGFGGQAGGSFGSLYTIVGSGINLDGLGQSGQNQQ